LALAPHSAAADAPGSPGPLTPGTLVPATSGPGEYRATPTGRRPPRDPLRDALVEDARAAAGRAGKPAPSADPRLDWAMTDLARRLRDDDLPDPEAVAFLLSHNGLVEPPPHIFFGQAGTGGDDTIRAHAGEEIAAALRAGSLGRVGVGIARTGTRLYVVAGFQETPIVLASPIARRLRSGGRAGVRARIDAAYHDPQLAITWPDGSVHEDPPMVHARTLAGELRCGADGRYQVEIVATGAVGPTVLANFPVYCGVSPPKVWKGAVAMRQGPADPAAAEQQIVALVNRDRARAGLPPVAADARLAAVARAHCQDMIDHDFVGHVSPRTGSAADRLHHAGLEPELVMENVGRFYSADQAEGGFLGSPGHRGNLLDPRATRIGVGVVFGPEVTGTRPLFVTQLLIK
jgi:uncharacterized protein YkwD